MSNKNRIYTVGVHAYWYTLVPPLQHSLVGDAVMSHQFEPLVRSGNRGILEPLAAKSWEFNKNRSKLRFTIDTSRRFSDGSYLCAADFKRSWEDGLRMQPVSNNSSLADVLANIRGVSAFKEKKEIEGLRVLGKDILELEFDKPVRSALEHLSGVRYAAYKTIGDKTIGTGPYVMTEKNQVLTLTPNSYYSGEAVAINNAQIMVVPGADALNKLRSGELDMVLFAEKAELRGCAEGKLSPIKCTFGQEGTHLLVSLNGMPGRFFSDTLHRKAFQVLLLKVFKNSPNKWTQNFQNTGFLQDSQSFLKFQAGRISDEEAESIITEGERYVPQLIEATQRFPLSVKAGQGWDWLIDYLKVEGIKLSENSEAGLEYPVQYN